MHTAFFPHSLHVVNENIRIWEAGKGLGTRLHQATFQLAWIISIDGLTILVHWVKHVINLGSISILPYCSALTT